MFERHWYWEGEGGGGSGSRRTTLQLFKNNKKKHMFVDGEKYFPG